MISSGRADRRCGVIVRQTHAVEIARGLRALGCGELEDGLHGPVRSRLQARVRRADRHAHQASRLDGVGDDRQHIGDDVPEGGVSQGRACQRSPKARLHVSSRAHNVSDECRGDGGESDQIDKWCSVVTTGTKPTPTKEQPITDRNTDR